MNADLLSQWDWANESFIGKAFTNKKNRQLYFPQYITVDTETMELRVVYSNSKYSFLWDRPLEVFIQKFERGCIKWESLS